MTNDNLNGHGTLDPATVKVAPVNGHIVKALSDALDRARMGRLHALVIVGVDGTDLSSLDAVVVDNMALAMIAQGALMVASSKITQGAREAQSAPVSKIVRPPTGMKL